MIDLDRKDSRRTPVSPARAVRRGHDDARVMAGILHLVEGDLPGQTEIVPPDRPARDHVTVWRINVRRMIH
jgi:hypothetical protein